VKDFLCAQFSEGERFIPSFYPTTRSEVIFEDLKEDHHLLSPRSLISSSSSSFLLLTNVAASWLGLLHCIQGVFNSNLGQNILEVRKREP
jgi:hypothetical protein